MGVQSSDIEVTEDITLKGCEKCNYLGSTQAVSCIGACDKDIRHHVNLG